MIYLVLVAVFSPEAGKWTFRIVFWLLGLAGAGLFLWLYRRRNRPAQLGTPSLKADVVSLFRQARARLAETRLGKKAKIGRLPMLIFIGEAGAAKTTAIVNSRTEPLHLAGQVYEENNIVSTPVVNLWLTGETIIAEVGPPVLEDPDAWAAFLRAIRPARLPALFSGREAPRSAVVCVSCERFLSQEAQDAAQSVARNLRTRVGELARSLGISVPVYVLFNKLDRIPSFLDFARNLTDNEAARSLGAAVAARDPRQAGVYSEQESQRLSQAFDGVYH
ncbi:MAG: hypothetical protein GY953_33375, partial [bacterium]|nr:hypothetical protein [bacterium]